MATNLYSWNSLPRKNVRSVKDKKQVTGTPKLVSQLQQINEQQPIEDGYRSLPRRLLKTVRRSLTLTREPTIRHRTDEERAEHEALEAKMREEEEDVNDPSKPSMKFDCIGKHSNDEKVTEFHRIYNLDYDKASIGGVIMLHQYCYKKYKTTGESIYRDGANFWKEVDWQLFSVNDRIPIRMLFVNLYTCETVEPWYRDYYTARDQDRLEIKLFTRDMKTENDRMYDQLGRDAIQIMLNEMLVMENYCLRKYDATREREYGWGADFWQRTSPLNYPRNYQLALLMGKMKNWDYKDINNMFKALYEEQSFRGARGFDLYPTRN